MEMLEVILYGIYALLGGVAAFMAYRLAYAYSHFRMKQLMSVTEMLDKLPSVTVCIPARNEDHTMTECLEHVIASSYPKLEIIVLNDGSRDNTGALIKAFAHEGVRFVEGSKLPKGWLGKNHALQELAVEASGTYIFFMDVDTRIQPDTIEQLVAYLKQENAKMISILPRREDGWRASVLFSTLRYFWELIFHRASAPATSSNAWMIHRDTLLGSFNGFNDFAGAVQPEAQFSRVLMKDNAYRFLIGTQLLGVAYEKKWDSQVDTSIRLLYPLLGGNVVNAILGVAGLLFLLTPLIILGTSLLYGWDFMYLLAIILHLAFTILYATYTLRVWKRMWWLGAILWPVIILQELIVLVVSTERYLLHLVTWKSRSITTTVSNSETK
jgi:glycosyltransferase involved in cell wall biosynthesis